MCRCKPASITTCCSNRSQGWIRSLPVLRDYDACTYYKYDAGKLMVGAFEPNSRPWGTEGIAEDFCFDEIAG